MNELIVAIALILFGRNGSVKPLRPAPYVIPQASVETIPDPLPYALPCLGTEDDPFVLTCTEYRPR